MAYTSETLADYMHATLRATATTLGWTSPTSYEHAVKEAISSYGAADIALATDQRRLELVAQVEAWRSVLAETTGDYDYDSGDTTIKRSQINSQAKAMLAQAQNALDAYDLKKAQAQKVDASASFSVKSQAVW